MTKQHALDAALNALSSFYEEGDDGDAVRMALDAIGSRLGLTGERPLLDADLDDGLKEAVKQLYDLAKEGEYGTGLTRAGATSINAIVDDVGEKLHAHLNHVRNKSEHRTPGRKRG